MSQNITALNPSPGGTQNALNVSAAGVIKNGPGTLMRVVTQVAGTGGALVVNDLAVNTGAAIGNQVANIPTADLIANGTPLVLEIPCKKGITISAVPTGGWVGVITYF